METGRRTFDIVLLYSSQRIHGYYLNIIKELATTLSIGVVAAHEGAKPNEKLRRTEKFYLGLCAELGAKIISHDSRCSCSLLLVPQNIYNDFDFTSIDFNKVVILHRFGSGAMSLEELTRMGAEKIWVYEESIFLQQLYHEGGGHFLDRLEVVEMGAPYRKYPVFDFTEFQIDYIIAYPTPMLLQDLSSQIDLLRNVLSLFELISVKDNVFLKHHNVRDGGFQFAKSKLYRNVGSIIQGLADRVNNKTMRTVSKVAATSVLLRLLQRNQIKILGSIIEGRTVFLSSLTDKYNLALEHFLPFVRKGVVTGISSCIWHALYQDIPVYNCDNQPLTEDMANYSVYRNFHIPSCRGKLQFEPQYFNKVSSSSKNADLIELIKQEF